MKKQDEPAKPDEKRRLPYEPPGVISEEVFETLALSCAKSDFTACSPGLDKS